MKDLPSNGRSQGRVNEILTPHAFTNNVFFIVVTVISGFKSINAKKGLDFHATNDSV